MNLFIEKGEKEMTFEEEWEELKKEYGRRIDPIMEEWNKQECVALDGGYEYQNQIDKIWKEYVLVELEKLKKKYGR